MKKILTLLLLTLLILLTTSLIFAQDSTQETALRNKIQEYEQKLSDLGQQKRTLSSQIQFMDTQISLTNYRIQDTEQKIEQTQNEIDLMTTRIEGLDTSLDYLSKLMLSRVVQGYKNRQAGLLDILLDSGDANELVSRVKYFKQAEENNQKLLIQVQTAKSNFEEQKTLREKKKVELDDLTKSLTAQKQDLDNQKAQKQSLLVQTGSDEATYQRLLAQAEAQLAAFGRFVTSQGGASLLSNQTVCDDWGCYYNQRDSQWGGLALNNPSTGYSIATAGCLLTSVAMIYTHYGHHNVSPISVNSNPDNFSLNTAMLRYTVSAEGTSSSRSNHYNGDIINTIDSNLQNGSTPVIVGISYDGGPLPDHFVVLISGSGGNYRMNDPFTSNGHNIPFSDHYSISSIREIDTVSM